MPLNDTQLKDVLLSQHYVGKDDIKRAERLAKERGAFLVDVLLAEGLITSDLVGQAFAESYGVPYADLNTHTSSREQVLTLSEEIGVAFRAIVFREDAESVTVATDDPAQPELLEALTKAFPGKAAKLAFAMPSDIDAALIHYRKELDTRFSKIIEEQDRVAPEIIDEILADALVFRASDVHFDPHDEDVVVRFRIDGLLQEAGRIPKEHYESVLNRIKVMARLRTDEHLAAQDGAIRYEHNEIVTDLRVSIAPVLDGEKVTLRVLSAYVRGLTLADLGLSARDQELLLEASSKPFGMLLVVGPTGSGKTTTMYGVLKHLNKPEVNIATIEDPVEYKIRGVNHIQVNRQTNLTFASGLRSIIRQDPDIILVGEIRDTETAEIGVNAALTGHLLLSTFHANDAATAFPRLLDMGVEPFLLASTLEVVLAQRLVRRICESCRFGETKTQEQLEKLLPGASRFFSEKKVTLYAGKGCAVCNSTGYSGRTAVFEFIRVTPELQDFILKRPSSREIWELAAKQGSRTMFEDGLEKVRLGTTTLEELLRVVEVPDTPTPEKV